MNEKEKVVSNEKDPFVKADSSQNDVASVAAPTPKTTKDGSLPLRPNRNALPPESAVILASERFVKDDDTLSGKEKKE